MPLFAMFFDPFESLCRTSTTTDVPIRLNTVLSVHKSTGRTKVYRPITSSPMIIILTVKDGRNSKFKFREGSPMAKEAVQIYGSSWRL